MDEIGSELSWSGQGTGSSRQAFLRRLSAWLPDAPAAPERVASAVLHALSDRLSGGVIARVLAELPPDLRPQLARYSKATDAPAPSHGKDTFYQEVATDLDIAPDQVRRVLHAVFTALHSQLTHAVSDMVSAELPKELSGTWRAARRRIEQAR